MVASSQGSGTTTLHVTATDDATSAVVIDKTIEVTGSEATVVDVSAPPSTYTFTVALVAGAVTVSTSSAQAHLMNGTTTQIALAAQAATMGGAASTVQIGVDVAPQITGVDVQATGSGTAAMTSITVNATDVNSDALTFFWSGATLSGAVQGTSTMSLSTAAIMAAASTTAPVLHVVVQDASGASAAANVALTVAGTSVQGAIMTSTDGGAALQACLDTQAKCNAACAPGVALGATGVSVSATCLASCSTSLASCELN